VFVKTVYSGLNAAFCATRDLNLNFQTKNKSGGILDATGLYTTQ